MISNIKKVHKKDGLTLIELIISLAIIGIISVAFLSLFGFGINTITMSGKKSSSDFNAQSIMESSISDDSITPPELTRTTGSSIKLYKSGVEYTINGDKLQVSYPYGSSTKTFTTFISNWQYLFERGELYEQGILEKGKQSKRIYLNRNPYID